MRLIKTISIVVGILLISGFSVVQLTDLFDEPVDMTCSGANPPVFEGEDEVTIYDDEGELSDIITAMDEIDGDITHLIAIQASSEIENSDPLFDTVEYTFRVKNSCGLVSSFVQTITYYNEPSFLTLDWVYPTGVFNYRNQSSDVRHEFFRAAEQWLLDRQVGGVPLYSTQSYVAYSQRLQLPVDEYLPVIGFGPRFGYLTEDDSTVLMYDGNPGEVGEYTYRRTTSYNPSTFHQYLYDTSTDEELMKHYYSSLYSYELNSDKTGYSLNPMMALTDPTPLLVEDHDSGNRPLSSTWSISLRQDLKWTFHPNIQEETGFDPNTIDPTINAYDFAETFKISLDEEWFRAISGGNDFINSPFGIKNLAEYVAGDADWEDVGIKVIDEYTLSFEFEYPPSEWDVKYFFSNIAMTPICVELYDYFETINSDDNLYGTDIYSIGYHGEYYIDEYLEDTVIRMKSNPNYHVLPEFHIDGKDYTGIDFMIVSDSAEIEQYYLDGYLEVSGLSSNSELIGTNQNVKAIPGTTVYRLNINGFKTVEAQLEQFPDSNFVPEPILGEVDFKLAMFHAINREQLATLNNRYPTMHYFNESYLINPEDGVIFRNTEKGQTVGSEMYPETYGYNPEVATSLFKNSVDQLIQEGYYNEGTEENPTIISIELIYYSNSEIWTNTATFIKESFESTFQYPEKNIYVNVVLKEQGFPAIYYDYMMVGNYDLSVGGISGSAFNAASFLDTYCSDNRSGFQVNWGIDTSVAEIKVQYITYKKGVINSNLEEDQELPLSINMTYHKEIWSFDAISSVLFGEIAVYEGEEMEFPYPSTLLKTPTSFTFEIEHFDDPLIENLTYTIQYYDLDEGYLDLEGYTDIPAESNLITISGLKPFYYGQDEFGNTIYQGDYQVVLEFNLTVDPDNERKEIGNWFELEDILLEEEVSMLPNIVTYDLTINSSDLTEEGRQISTMNLFERQSDGSYLEIDAVFDFSDLSNTVISSTEFNYDTTYLVKVEFSDGYYDYISFDYSIIVD